MCIGDTVGRKERSPPVEYKAATFLGSLVCRASFHFLKFSLATARKSGPAGRTDEWWCEIFHEPSSFTHTYEKRACTGARSAPVPSSNVYKPECRYASPVPYGWTLSSVMVPKGFFCTNAVKYSSVLVPSLMCIGDTVGRNESASFEYKSATLSGSLVCRASFQRLKLVRANVMSTFSVGAATAAGATAPFFCRLTPSAATPGSATSSVSASSIVTALREARAGDDGMVRRDTGDVKAEAAETKPTRRTVRSMARSRSRLQM
mmetsp:Transcript_8979/g.28506  ORF Transcript_8979/g.28506 Transcript_8979/m.28506 type:complete len:262 (-) Transcript_8979:30-815(-)